VYPEDVRVFAINPGSTSTKLALLEAGENGVEVLREHTERHAPAPSLPEDLERRRELVHEQARAWAPFDAIAARGGLIGPVPAGVYAVDEAMAELCLSARHGAHPANLAAPLALELAREHGVPAMVDTNDALLGEGPFYVAETVRRRIEWAAPVVLVPGEFEMEALAEGVRRALAGEEKPRRIREVAHGNAGL